MGAATNNIIIYDNKVSIEKANIMNRYNQVPHLTQGTTWESDKNTRKNQIRESQKVSPFQAGDHKVVINRQDSMKVKKHKITKKGPQMEQGFKSDCFAIVLLRKRDQWTAFLCFLNIYVGWEIRK